jgi:hypothetical protein
MNALPKFITDAVDTMFREPGYLIAVHDPTQRHYHTGQWQFGRPMWTRDLAHAMAYQTAECASDARDQILASGYPYAPVIVRGR